MSLELRQLRDAVEKDLPLAMAVGGELVLGTTPTSTPLPEKETQHHEHSAAASGRSAAGPWAGQRTPSYAPPDSASHPVRDLRTDLLAVFGGWQGNGIDEGELEGLAEYVPDIRISVSTPRATFFAATLHPFPATGVGFRLVWEVPHPRFAIPVRSHVPPVRAWSRWVGGPAHGHLVVSHHKQPDFSMCVCMPHEFRRGIRPLVDYVSMCASWCAKVQYQTEYGWFPGRQHYSALDRMQRDAVAEFCGCGAERPYETCCRHQDRSRGLAAAIEENRQIRAEYFEHLKIQRRAIHAPDMAWSLK